jgi:uncharacterized glyoxalase superfamily protein PhnB
MPQNLNVVEIKAFIPAKDFELSKRFYTDIGFTKASDGEGVAYFHCGNSAFLVVDRFEEGSDKPEMHLLVEDVDDWHQKMQERGIASRYNVEIGSIKQQPWRMREFDLFDPSGVRWRVAMNTD